MLSSQTLKWPFKEKEVMNTIDTLERQKNALKLAIGVQNLLVYANVLFVFEFIVFCI